MCIKAFGELTPGELFAAVRLRQAVFYLEQHVTCEDLDALDPAALFLWCEAEGETVGCLRILPPGVRYAEASVGRVAVAAAWRRRGVARRMMRAALEYIDRTWGAGAHLVAGVCGAVLRVARIRGRIGTVCGGGYSAP